MQLDLTGSLLQASLDLMPTKHRGAGYQLIVGDSLQLVPQMPPHSVDLVFADPPYHLSNGGSTMSGGERVAVKKGDWDKSRGLHGDHVFHRTWLAAVQRVLRPSGTLWVSGTHHCLFSVGYAMQSLGFNVLNLVTWCKPNAPANLGCRQFTHSTEGLVWAAPREIEPLPHVFNYRAIRTANNNKQVRDFWNLPLTQQAEKKHGSHATQKPLALLDKILTASTAPNALVLDPFNGSGTTGVVSIARGRRYIGIDLDAANLDVTQARLACTNASCGCRKALFAPAPKNRQAPRE